MTTLGDLMEEGGRSGFRGDPHLWAAMRDRLRDVPLPVTREATELAYLDAFEAEVGERLETTTKEFFKVEKFEHGGMTSGGIHVATWRDENIPLLLTRWDAATSFS